MVVCPLTSKRKPYPFALPVKVDKVEGALLVDQLKSLDWAGPARAISFQCRGQRRFRECGNISPCCLEFADVEAALSWCRYGITVFGGFPMAFHPEASQAKSPYRKASVSASSIQQPPFRKTYRSPSSVLEFVRRRLRHAHRQRAAA